MELCKSVYIIFLMVLWSGNLAYPKSFIISMNPSPLTVLKGFRSLTIYFVTARFILIWDPKNAFVIGFGESLTSHFLFILGFRLKLSAPNFLQNYHRYIKIITLIYNYLPRTYRGIRARAFNI